MFINRLIFILLSLALCLNATSFSQSKKILLKKIYNDNQNTFYCNNPYEVKTNNSKQQTLIIQNEQYYSPRKPFYKSGQPNTRAKRVEWEHVMPVPFIFSKYGQEKSLKLYIVKS